MMRYSKRALIGLLAIAATAAPATAQRVSRDSVRASRDSVREEGQSRLEVQIERLAREVMSKRIVQQELIRRIARAAESAQREDARELLSRQLVDETRAMRSLQGELRALCGEGEKSEGWLGVTFVGSPRVEQRGHGLMVFHFDEFPEIVAVEPGSPAEQAGLASGDVIVSIGQRDVRNRDISFSALLRPGARLPVRVRRDGRMREATVVVTPRPQAFGTQCPWIDARIARALPDAPSAFSFYYSVPAVPPPPGTPAVAPRPSGSRVIRVRPPAPAATPTPSGEPAVAPLPPLPALAGFPDVGGAGGGWMGGAVLARLDAGWRDALGVKDGALVMRVLPGTPAERAGLRNGDVIVRADGRRITSPAALDRAVRDAGDGPMKLQVVRRRKAMTVTLRW